MSRIARYKAVLWLILCAPLFVLGYRIWIEIGNPGAALGADPGEAVVHFLGEWALVTVLIAFSVSPFRQLFINWSWTKPWLGYLLARSRRLVGLFAFFYVTLHLLAYVAFYLQFSLEALWLDIVERAYITAGMAAFAALVVMAITSTRGWQRRLKQTWQKLHKLIYAVVALAIIHLWWLTRDDFTDVVIYASWFVFLLVWRWRLATTRQHSFV